METQNKIETVHGSEMIIKPIANTMLMGSSSNVSIFSFLNQYN